ncbi:MAG: helix-turn-helix transcriptional regulator [Lachnospiraceae bacterium]|nr:helix-turn-helix transcriptional regulator [Lachnospiraceae bacterium]
MEKSANKLHLKSAAVTGICFLLTSTAYLAWTYRVVELAEAPIADAVTLIAAYLMQAAGIGLFALLLRRRPDLVQKSVYAALGLHMLFLVPSVLCSAFVQVLIFGCVLNLLCGWIAGYYLYRLAGALDASVSAMTLGVGYSAAIFASWLLSLPGRELVYSAKIVMVICALLTVAAVVVIRMRMIPESTYLSDGTLLEGGSAEAVPKKMRLSEGARSGGDSADIVPAKAWLSDAGSSSVPESSAQYELPQDITQRQFLLLAGALVLLLSMVNSCGFSFPSADIRNGISVEFSRLFYATGLLIAGYANDRNRRYGAVCAIIALVIPFFILAAHDEPVSSNFFWALSYFASGFYTVYRIILFSDISRDFSLIPLCGFGLLIGRIGDAAGEVLCLALSGHFLILVAAAALLFVASMLLFLHVYRVLYFPVPQKQKSEQEIFIQFSESYNLSAREREVLRFLLEEKTNQEIADELCISDGTVKYHIHNLLQKTGCPNRLKLISTYAASR